MYFKLGVKELKSDFFNFEVELNSFLRELRSNETRMIVIRGVRRTGKSSLLRVGLLESGFPHIILDARKFGIFSSDYIYDIIADSLSKLVEKYKSITRYLGKVRGLSLAGFEVSFTSRDKTTIIDSLEKINEWSIREVGQVILALDEAQDFLVFPKFDGLVAHIYDYLDGIKIVLAGSEVGVLDRLLGKRRVNAPLYGRPYFTIAMGRLPKNKAEEFLRKGFEQIGIKVLDHHITEAIDYFDGIIGWLTSYGYYTSKLGHEDAIVKTLEDGVRLVEEEIKTFLMQRLQARLRYLTILKITISPSTWSEIKTEFSARIGRKISDKQLSHYLAELVNYGFIEKIDNKYRLADPMIRYAVSRIK
ncbi:MAG: ATP-binding protein [Candidatus Methanomethylicia archaeon]